MSCRTWAAAAWLRSLWFAPKSTLIGAQDGQFKDRFIRALGGWLVRGEIWLISQELIVGTQIRRKPSSIDVGRQRMGLAPAWCRDCLGSTMGHRSICGNVWQREVISRPSQWHFLAPYGCFPDHHGRCRPPDHHTVCLRVRRATSKLTDYVA